MVLFWGMFLIYLFSLVSIILFKGESPMAVLSYPRTGTRLVNWEPLYFMNDLTDINVIGNVLLFIPFGMYVAILLKRKWSGIVLMFLVSVSFEATQFILNIGALDVDDVLLNVSGGILGMLIVGFLSLFLKNKQRLKAFMAIASTLMGVPLLILWGLLQVANR